MTVDDFLSKLSHVRKNGGAWRARCPAHADRDPSLTITPAADKLLLHCHAGCSTDAICGALGLELRDLFSRNGSAPPPAQIVATYDYTDEAGTLLYQVCRFAPKGFRQRRPDGQGGWEWKLGEVRRVLYKLPDVVKAKVVHLVEGERDADNVTALGLTVTTAPMGAGKWQQAYSESLRDKAVVIWPDADAPGQAHAEQVAHALSGVAASVKVVPVPEGKKDLSAWLEARDGADPDTLRAELLALVEAAPVFLSSPIGSDLGGKHFAPLSAAELLARPDPPIDWLWENMIPTGSLCLFAAFMKVGKSELAYHFLVALAQGRPFLDLATRPARLLLLAVEEHPRDVTKRLRRVGLRAEDPLFVHAAPLTNTPEVVDSLTAFIVEQSIDLVCLDTLTRFWNVESENDNAQIVREVSPLLDLTRRTGAAVLLIHHDRKSGGEDGKAIRGGSALFGLVDQAFMLERRPGQSETQRSLKTLGRYADSPKELVLDLHAGQYVALGRPAEVGIKATRTLIWDALTTTPKSLETLAADTGHEDKLGEVRKVIAELLKAGQIDRTGKGVKHHPYRYARQREDSSDSFLPKSFLYREESISTAKKDRFATVESATAYSLRLWPGSQVVGHE